MSSSLTLTLRVSPSFLTISPPPPLHSRSLQFHILPHTRPILSISSLFFISCSSSRNPRKTTFRSRVSRASVGTVVRPPFSTSLSPRFSYLFTTFRPLLISFLFFDSLTQNSAPSSLKMWSPLFHLCHFSQAFPILHASTHNHTPPIHLPFRHL